MTSDLTAADFNPLHQSLRRTNETIDKLREAKK